MSHFELLQNIAGNNTNNVTFGYQLRNRLRNAGGISRCQSLFRCDVHSASLSRADRRYHNMSMIEIRSAFTRTLHHYRIRKSSTLRVRLITGKYLRQFAISVYRLLLQLPATLVPSAPNPLQHSTSPDLFLTCR